MILRWLMAVAAHIRGLLLTLDVTRLAVSKLMSADQRHGVQFRREGRVLEAGWGVTGFAIGPEVRLAR
jgi:hypothetical protein